MVALRTGGLRHRSRERLDPGHGESDGIEQGGTAPPHGEEERGAEDPADSRPVPAEPTPIDLMEMMQMAAIKATRSPYSASAAPSSDAPKRRMAWMRDRMTTSERDKVTPLRRSRRRGQDAVLLKAETAAVP